mgnify:CR=1 FL=1
MDAEDRFYIYLRYAITIAATAILVVAVSGIHACYVDARALQRACVERGGIYTDIGVGSNDFKSGCYRATVVPLDSVKVVR